MCPIEEVNVKTQPLILPNLQVGAQRHVVPRRNHFNWLSVHADAA